VGPVTPTEGPRQRRQTDSMPTEERVAALAAHLQQTELEMHERENAITAPLIRRSMSDGHGTANTMHANDKADSVDGTQMTRVLRR
jgi:hypothetical protein